MSLLKYFTSNKTRETTNTNQTSTQSESVDVVEAGAEPEVIVEAGALNADSQETSTGKRKLQDDCSEKTKKSKRAVSFKDSWKKGRPWLAYVNGKGMFCQSCQRHNMRPFDRDTWNKKPCERMRLESVTDHERSTAHKSALKLDYEATKHADVAIAIVPRVNMTDMTKTFACLYHLVKQRIAHTTNLKPMLDLLEYLQVSLNLSNGPNYTSRTSIQEMLYCMSEVIETKLMNELLEADHFAILFDETTDCSVKEQMIVRARYVKEGMISVKFLKIIEPLATTADQDPVITLSGKNIAQNVINFIESKNLRYDKLRAIGTDGASVMTGRVNGAVQLIINKQLESQKGDLKCQAVGCHCAAHKLNLAATQAGDSIPYVKKFKAIIRQLFDFYNNSAVRTAGLLAVQKLLVQPELKVLQPSSTRWLSTGNCVDRLKKILGSIIISLGRESEERGDAAAAGLYKFLSEYNFIATLLLFCDTLPTINRLSLIFQSRDIDYALLATVVDSTKNTLSKLRNADGKNLGDIQLYIAKLEENGVTVTYNRRNLRAGSSDPDETKKAFSDNIKSKFVDNLISNLDARFTDSDLMAAFHIFDPKAFTLAVTHEEGDGDDDSNDNVEGEADDFDVEKVRADYGKDKIKILADRFGYDQDVDSLIQEWDDFKQYMSDHWMTKSCRDVVKTLSGLEGNAMKVIYPGMSWLAEIYRVIPPHTADVERDFSQMKLIKTYLRNRMNEQTLDSIMRIVIEGPILKEFPFEEVVNLWAAKKNRRVII